MNEHAEVELLLERLAAALHWQPMEHQRFTDSNCHLFNWKPEDRARLLAQLNDDNATTTPSLDLG